MLVLGSTIARRVALAAALGLAGALLTAPAALAHRHARGAHGASLRTRGSGGVSSKSEVHAGGHAAATLQSCHLGAGAGAGAGAEGEAGETGEATFSAQMEALPGTVQMEMRFEIISRAAGESGFHRPPGAGAAARGNWRRSSTNVGVFTDSDEVAGLLAPAQYRARVHFRWLDAEGSAVAWAVHHTEACRQASSGSASSGSASGSSSSTAPGSSSNSASG